MSEVGFRDSLWPESLVCYDLTLPTVDENLSIDEALLAIVDEDPTAACLRFWQPAEHVVVLGRSNQVETEVNLGACISDGISILRRASGGGTVLLGPGCLCYSLVLPITDLHRSMGVSGTTAELMARTAMRLQIFNPEIAVCGTSDLTCDGLKFSGNAQRWLRRAFIHHGTLLFDFDLPLFSRYLKHPAREPDYRQARRHSDFVTNVNLTSEKLRQCVSSAWNAIPAECSADVLSEAGKILAARYTSAEWRILARL